MSGEGPFFRQQETQEPRAEGAPPPPNPSERTVEAGWIGKFLAENLLGWTGLEFKDYQPNHLTQSGKRAFVRGWYGTNPEGQITVFPEIAQDASKARRFVIPAMIEAGFVFESRKGKGPWRARFLRGDATFGSHADDSEAFAICSAAKKALEEVQRLETVRAEPSRYGNGDENDG